MMMSLPAATQTVACVSRDLLEIKVRIAPSAAPPNQPTGQFWLESSTDKSIVVDLTGDVHLNDKSGCLTVKYRLVNQGSDPDLIFRRPDSMRASDREFGSPALDLNNKRLSIHYNNNPWAWPWWGHNYNIRAYDKGGKVYDADPVYHNKPPVNTVLTIFLGIFLVALAVVVLNFSRVVRWLRSVR